MGRIGYNRAMRVRLSAWLPMMLLLLPLPVLVARLGLFVTHSAAVLAFPWQLDFDEGIILHASWLLAHGRSPYPPLTPDHFASSLYPPLFYALNAAALRVWGLNLWSGRALELGGTLLAAGSLVAWTVAETRSRWVGWLAGAVAAAVWLALGPVIVWATFYKQDSLALGFGALGGAMLAWAWRSGAAVSRSPQRGEGRLAWPALVPLVLAVWTKQTALAPLLAGGIVALGRGRAGRRWCMIAVPALGGPLLLLNEALGGQLLTHLLMAGAEPLTPARLGKNVAALAGEAWPLLIGAGVVLVGGLGAAVRTRRVPPLSVCYALVTLPLTAWTNLSPHANYNHLLPGLLAACLLVGVGLGRLAEWATLRRWAVLPLAGAVGLLLVQGGLFAPLKTWYSPLGQPLDEKAARLEILAGQVAAVRGRPVLAEDGRLALQAGKQLPYDDPAQMTIQAAAGRWDESTLLADIRRHRFGMLILEHDIAEETFTPRWSPAVLAALQAEYQLKYRDVRFLWVPRPPPAEPLQVRDCTSAGGPRLRGVWLPGDGRRLVPGDSQPISLYWAAPAAGTAPQPDLKFSLRLLDPAGGAVWQADLPPGSAAGTPWPHWTVRAAPRDDLAITVPPTAPPGAYRLALSAYRAQNGTLVPVPFTCAGSLPGDLTLAQPQMDRQEEP